ncbi:uncharacterized protein isoform X2 [Salmo salar]|uniref:Uncharacterized protein isoform X2 n=1 Tax=Salmo salar TaxID=8030 RepID=A0ABM3D317_SALSA|nr:uncharacterized protein LOC123727824 isoform X2 [Salmo salar]
MQEADLKTDGTSQSQKVEGEIELDEAVAIPSQSQKVEGEIELDEAVAIPSQSQKVEGEIELDEAVAIPSQSQKVEGEIELDEAVVIPSQSKEAAVVTFTNVTPKAAASQTSLTVRGKRSYPELKHPEISTSIIYRSLFLDSSLVSSNMVTESIIFNSPRPSEENVSIQKVLPADKVDILHGQPVEECIVKAEQCITQDAAVTCTAMLDKTDACGKLNPVYPCFHREY